VIKEPIVAIDDDGRRLVWGAEGGSLKHYNASVQVFPHEHGSRVVWTADLLPHEAAPTVGSMMDQGMAVMARTLDGLAE